MIKPGWKTTEFWLTAAAMAVILVVVAHSSDPLERRLAVGAMPASIGVYAHGRARVKSAGTMSFIAAIAKLIFTKQ
jgi:hypothetical protein